MIKRLQKVMASPQGLQEVLYRIAWLPMPEVTR